MTYDEFMQNTEELENFYEKKLNATQTQVWFEELKNYAVEKYKKTLQQLFKTSQYRPTLDLVLKTIKNLKSEVIEKEKVECKLCKGTGYLLYTKKIDNTDYTYACLCNCENAKGLEYDGRALADKERRSDFYLAKAEDVFFNKPFIATETEKQMII